MTEPIRVLHVIGIMNRGGAETMIMNLYRHIDRTKVQFDFVENDGDPAAFDDEIRELGGRIYRCPRYRGKNHLAYAKWWHDFFDSHKGEYPVVHGHIGSTAAIYLSIAKRHGAYAIAHSHSAGVGSIMYRTLAYPTRYLADHFFACSRDAGISRYGKRVGGNSERCQVLNNAIDTRKFACNAEVRVRVRDMLGVAEDTLVVGHVGRFVDAKNHLFLLDIFEQLRKHSPSSVLVLVGDGELRPQIEEKIVQKHLEDAVIMTGVKADVWNYYQAMDVFVFPSIYEGVPVSMVEAQTAGLPCCISANVPRETAITDLVEFIPLELGPEYWADRIMQRAKEPRRDMTGEIKQAGFDVSATSKWLENFYRKVVAERGRAH